MNVAVACFIVGVTNVFLNYLVQRAASQDGEALQNLFSLSFLAAFCVGVVSLLFLFLLYSSRVELGRAILLMGATSIVGGSLFGLAVSSAKFSMIEWALLGLISLFYVARFLEKWLPKM